MRVVIGLPNHIARVDGSLIAEWARRAEQYGFAGVTTIDRLVYPSLDSIVALSVAAGATRDLRLITNVLLAPLYPAALLAKQLASLADISGNRLTLGLGVGRRTDDYAATGADFHQRGRVIDQTIDLMRQAWQADVVTGDVPLCPAPVQIPVLFGGASPVTLRRVATVGDGWAAGAVRDYANQSSFADRVRAAWQQAGRAGTPWLNASVNFAFGDPETVYAGQANLRNYYGFVPEYAELNVADMLATPHDAVATVRAYRDLGFDGLLFHPSVASLDQLERLADAVL
ncbi:LLM class flavin-dependent oxidoreductase [Mycolicibacter terrae]|uniref:LLM class flavin-dependent oxidoreductase n=1 Tax=Mycolicibacter terrae TaxID=1788 RepID=A0ACD2EIX5_9MYCO|nr:LLM class flavin-dependent oxidoreductase [Mycolicibacter terrae]RRR41889.1 LLM class flavin-dependent oxidoreductase [Mycolicibacter terrae]